MWLLLANGFVAKTNLLGFALPINYSFLALPGLTGS
jgi:hypothetical protein